MPPDQSTRRPFPTGVAWRLFLTCWLVYALHFATNTVREIYPALSLADHGSFDVSEYVGLHPDIFELPGRTPGRGAFINNTPGASILGAIPYTLARPLVDRIVARVEASRAGTPPPAYDSVYPLARKFYEAAYERGLDVKFGLAAGVMQAGLMAPLSALSVVVMFAVLDRLTGARRTALWLAILYAFATPIFYRTAQLNHNLLQAHFAFFAFLLLWRPDGAGKRPLFFLAGLLAGWTVVLDYSGAVIVAALSLYALARWAALPGRAWSDLVRYGAGVALAGAVLAGYQWYYFGNPLLPAQHYMPDTRFSGYGYQGLDWPQPDLIIELLFGMRYGLFTSAPLLLLTLYIPGWISRRTRLIGRRETWFVLLFSLAFLLFTAANQFSRMQFNTGVRHIVPIVPFLFLIAAGILPRLPRLPAAVFAVLATYWSWALAMYRDVELGLGIPESLIHVTFEGFRLPWMETLEQLGFFGEVTAVPILLLAAVLIWLIWRGSLTRSTHQ